MRIDTCAATAEEILVLTLTEDLQGPFLSSLRGTNSLWPFCPNFILTQKALPSFRIDFSNGSWKTSKSILKGPDLTRLTKSTSRCCCTQGTGPREGTENFFES